MKTELLFIVDERDPYRGTLNATVWLDGRVIAETEEQRVFTEATLHMMTHKPSIRAHMLREYSGVIRLTWKRDREPMLAIYLDCSVEDWWQVLRIVRAGHTFYEEEE